MIKALEIKASTLFTLNFANNTILSCFYFFLLIIDFYFWLAAVITQICNLVSELVIPIGILTKEAKAKMEAHPVTVDIEICKCSISFKTSQTFYASHSLIHSDLFL